MIKLYSLAEDITKSKDNIFIIKVGNKFGFYSKRQICNHFYDNELEMLHWMKLKKKEEHYCFKCNKNLISAKFFPSLTTILDDINTPLVLLYEYNKGVEIILNDNEKIKKFKKQLRYVRSSPSTIFFFLGDEEKILTNKEVIIKKGQYPTFGARDYLFFSRNRDSIDFVDLNNPDESLQKNYIQYGMSDIINSKITTFEDLKIIFGPKHDF